ncbi:MAG TPA: TauD/TfdA family dioxygenase [Casimicrobiaceae bacterium]|nr:TauD/TfdA family dioxygenase [Casimicrobiaceae bacterium]
MQPDVRSSPFQREKLAIRPLSGGLGAEVPGVDLRGSFAGEIAERIREAFLSHHLIVVRDQHLTSTRMGEFAMLFGELEGNVFRNPDGSTLGAIHEISNLDADGQPAENPYLKSNYHWHTDKAYLPIPALLTMLHAIELPQNGGDTQFADMTRAYDALSDDEKRRIADLRVVHSLEYMRASTGDRPPTEAERSAAPPVMHPLVRKHPQTGEKSLFLGMYCAYVVGMEPSEGRALLDRLLAHATQPRFVYTHRWQPGDLVFWDNRCLLHRAVANYDMGKSRRVLQRLVVKGDAAP